MKHSPQEFKVVSQSDNSVTVAAMCICGGDNCCFVATTYARDIYNDNLSMNLKELK